METGLILFAVLVSAVYLLVLPVLTLLAWSRSAGYAKDAENVRRAWRELDARLRDLQRRFDAMPASAPADTPLPVLEPAVAPEASAPFPPPVVVSPTEEAFVPPPVEAAAPVAPQPKAVLPAPNPPAAERRAPTEPGAVAQAIHRTTQAARAWLFGGNTFVRIGMLLVFLGLAFLLRYTSDYLPLELRYLGVAAAALGALAIGWRLRLKRPAFGLLMQGGAVAVMYLTVFAALKLHDQPLMSTQAGFALLVVVVLLSGMLAVVQDAMAMALAGALGGFATPVLLASGGGSHVALFSYFALLNTGILGIAWFKAWRPLNLVGFVGTFSIGMGWGARNYDPSLHFATTEPFLILFFLMFVLIGLLFARRMLLADQAAPASRDVAAWSAWWAQPGRHAQRYVDGSLLFGVPLVGFGVQTALIEHIEYGVAVSALVLGFFYLSLARAVYGAHPSRLRLLTEVFLALGMVFSSLAIPLGLDAQWTTAAWAMEGAGLYWLGDRQQRPVARGFALLLQGGAIVAFLGDVRLASGPTLLEGSALGALILGLSFLADYGVLRRRIEAPSWDARLGGLFATLGLWGVFLVAPMALSCEYAAVAWSLAGSLTVFVGLRWRIAGSLGNGLLVQLFAGGLFLARLDAEGNGVLDHVLGLAGSPWQGLIIATLIGVASLASLGIALGHARRQNNGVLETRLAWATLFGLGFVSLAVLFVLPWQSATPVWAMAGFAVMWAARRLRLRPAFWFALALEAFAGMAFLAVFRHYLDVPLPPSADVPWQTAFLSFAFWAPLVIALSAFAVAWRLHVWGTGEKDQPLGIDGGFLSLPVLLWSAFWWILAWWPTLRCFDLIGNGAPDALELTLRLSLHHFLVVMAVTALPLQWIALRWRWPRLLVLCLSLLGLTVLCALSDYEADADLLRADGWLAYGLALLACGGLLRLGGSLLRAQSDRLGHMANAWVWLGVAALEMRYLFLALGEMDSAWRWLGWVLPLAAWLLWSARKTPPRLWPAVVHPQAYRFSVTAPLLVVLLIWLFGANLVSSGSAEPLPFIPVFNPLDIALVLVLYAGFQWAGRLALQEEGVVLAWRERLPPLRGLLMAGAFLTYTCIVLRAAHHLAGVGWSLTDMQASMPVQAALSIAWALLALGLMIVGHRRVRRGVWIAGAVLVALVIAKLFFVELSHRGGVERIVSFIGVGLLLLVVGYFAPLPPSRETKGVPESSHV